MHRKISKFGRKSLNFFFFFCKKKGKYVSNPSALALGSSQNADSNLKNLKIVLKASNLSDALKAYENEEVVIHFSGELKPVFLTETYENMSMLQLMQPVRAYN